MTAFWESPLTASDDCNPRMNPTTVNTNKITIVRPAKVSAVRSGRRNRLRIAYSQGSSRKKIIAKFPPPAVHERKDTAFK
jgi:hypothetical protein